MTSKRGSITSMMKEKRVFDPSEEFRKDSLIKSLDEYMEQYKASVEDPGKFWGKKAVSLDWFKKWSSVFDWDRDEARFSWFKDGKLNVSYNCLDRHLEDGRKNKAAIIWQGESDDEVRIFTYQELSWVVSKFANVLKAHKLKKGDRVAIYLPMLPELVISMLACARLGIVHSVVFGGFSAEALADRINDAGCKMLVTSDGGYRSGKTIQLKMNADKALRNCPTIQSVIVVKRTGEKVNMQRYRDSWWDQEMGKVTAHCKPEIMDAEDPLFILYTSGSTGKPKGVLHTTAGYLLYVSETFKYVFDSKEDDTFWCTADIGWVTGHSYIVYGPLANGATSLMFEGVPTYPGPDRFWQMVEKFRVNVLYTAPTAIRAIAKEGDELPEKWDLSSLRLLGTVGEPINPEAWMWYHEKIGNNCCPIVDTWWQTETGGIVISPLPGAVTLKPGCVTVPFFGIEPIILREDGSEADINEGGSLVIKRPWPGLMRTLYGNHDRYKETYWSLYPGMYFSGDGARKDEDGYYWIMGRVDDVINVSGHRLGTAEIESALVSHPDVAEAAVVGYPHRIKGQGIYAFVTVNAGVLESDELKDMLIKHVRNQIGPIAKPDHIQFAPALPKTRSGKIMRRILKKIAAEDIEDLGDTCTLSDPSVIEELKKSREEERKQNEKIVNHKTLDGVKKIPSLPS